MPLAYPLVYIDENLNNIIQNPDNVLYLRPYDIGCKRALFAIVKEDKGVYKKVQLTKEQSNMSFPFEPIYWFYNGPGHRLLKDFISFYNKLALNTTNLDGFKTKTLENKIYNVGVFATFNDGSATFVIRESEKKFDRKGGIQSYIDLLKQYKEYNPQYDTYEIIEFHSVNNDTFIIPELQNRVEERSKVKKLTRNNKRL